MKKLLRLTRRIVGAQKRTAQQATTQPNLFQRHEQMYRAAIYNVWFFYIAGLFFAAHITSTGWPDWINRETISPLWPLFWAKGADLPTLTNIIMVILIVTSIPVAVQPQRRAYRILYFVGLFLCVAYINSFGKISHGFHAWIFVAFIYCFLPNWSANGQSRSGHRPIAHRQQFLTILFAAQAMLLLFYSMSGAWKVYAAINQMQAGQIHAFHPYALAYLTADRLLQTSSWTLLGPLLIKYPILGWPLHIGAIYLELFSLVAAFRPALHRFWGLMLLLFHFGTILIFFVGFTPNMLLLGLLLIMSPFAPTDGSLRDVLIKLPLFGDLYRILQKRR